MAVLLEASKYLRPQLVHLQGCGSLEGRAAFVNLQTGESHHGIVLCMVCDASESQKKCMVYEEARVKAVGTVLVLTVLGKTCVCLAHNIFMDS